MELMSSDAAKYIGELAPEDQEPSKTAAFHYMNQLGLIRSNGYNDHSVGSSLSSEIVEIDEEKEEDDDCNELFEIKDTGLTIMDSIKEENDHEVGSLFSFDIDLDRDNIVYVAIWKGSNEEQSSAISTDALLWTLNHAVVPSSTTIYLIHVFPESRTIPTPLGKLPMSQANPEQKESFMTLEIKKRREILQKFLDLCSASKVPVDTILIESDVEAKAILDLIPILNIRKLVLGTTKSSLRKMRSKRGSVAADQILQNAPEFCEVKIICEGKEVSQDQLTIESSPSPTPSLRRNVLSPKPIQVQGQTNDSFTCSCFKPKAVS